MRYVIVGPQGAGKSTFGGFLAEALGTKATDTSAWLVDVENARQKALWERYQITPWMGKAPTDEQIAADIAKGDLVERLDLVYGWDDLRNRPCRELLVALGDAVNSVGPTFLVDRCFEQGNIAIGVRRKNELAAIKEKYPEVIVLYIDPSLREGTERSKDNFELEREDAHFVLAARTIEVAKAQVTWLLDEILRLGPDVYVGRRGISDAS